MKFNVPQFSSCVVLRQRPGRLAPVWVRLLRGTSPRNGEWQARIVRRDLLV